VRSALEWAMAKAMAADGLSKREIVRRLGINRRTVSRLLDSDEPPRYRRARQGSRIDPFERSCGVCSRSGRISRPRG
jgi:DNA invertase Pin-like site-specific DNA recombinase